MRGSITNASAPRAASPRARCRWRAPPARAARSDGTVARRAGAARGTARRHERGGRLDELVDCGRCHLRLVARGDVGQKTEARAEQRRVDAPLRQPAHERRRQRRRRGRFSEPANAIHERKHTAAAAPRRAWRIRQNALAAAALASERAARYVVTMDFDIKHRDGRVLWSGEAFDLANAVQKAVDARADLAGANLAELDLAGANLESARLAGANLARARLRNANLEEADLRDAESQRRDARRRQHRGGRPLACAPRRRLGARRELRRGGAGRRGSSARTPKAQLRGVRPARRQARERDLPPQQLRGGSPRRRARRIRVVQRLQPGEGVVARRRTRRRGICRARTWSAATSAARACGARICRARTSSAPTCAAPNLTDCDFRESNLNRVDVDGAKMDGAKMESANTSRLRGTPATSTPYR